MTPASIGDYQVYHLSRNTEPVSKNRFLGASGKLSPDGSHIALLQLCHTVRLAKQRNVAPLGVAVSHVLGVSAKKQVRRANTERIIAHVADEQLLFKLPVCDAVRKPMGSKRLAATPKATISIARSASPLPTGTDTLNMRNNGPALVHVSPKLSLDRLWRLSGCRSMRVETRGRAKLIPYRGHLSDLAIETQGSIHGERDGATAESTSQARGPTFHALDIAWLRAIVFPGGKAA